MPNLVAIKKPDRVVTFYIDSSGVKKFVSRKKHSEITPPSCLFTSAKTFHLKYLKNQIRIWNLVFGLKATITDKFLLSRNKIHCVP